MLDFAILGLPRSRTAWFSAFLTTDSVHCWHEYSAVCNDDADFLSAMVPGKVSGIADTGVVLMGERLPYYVRRAVVIHRQVEECEAAVLARFGHDVPLGWVADLLDGISGMHIDYRQLSDVDTVRKIWEYATQTPFKPERFAVFDRLRIETMTDWFVEKPTGTWLEREVIRCRSLQAPSPR